MIYVLNLEIIKALAQGFGKPELGLHIHPNRHTPGHIVCWPQEIKTIAGAKEVFSDWAGLV